MDVNSGREISFVQLEDEVVSSAGSLQKLGVLSRTKVQSYADNALEFMCNASVFVFKPSKSTKCVEYKFQTERTPKSNNY